MTGPLCISNFRKPQRLFMYVPFTSAHPKAMFRAIVLTELTRLIRTCDREVDFVRSRAVAFAKFRARGYPDKLLQSCEARRSFARKHHVDFVAPKSCTTVVPFKIKFFPQADEIGLSSALSCHWHLLKIDNIRPVLCFKSNRNLFRLRYSRFLGGVADRPPGW